MDDNAAVTKLLEEVGPLLDPAAISYAPDDQSWTVSIDAETLILLAFDEGGGALEFVTPLGAVPDASAERAHEILLRFSYLWRETGGLYAALDDNGDAALLYRRPLAGLDGTQLNNLLGNLAQQRAVWADVLRTPPEDIESVVPDVPPFGGIRV